MLEYPDVQDDYASYASIRDNNCVGYTCLNGKDIEVRQPTSRTTSAVCRTRRPSPSTDRSSPRKSARVWRRRRSGTGVGRPSSISTSRRDVPRPWRTPSSGYSGVVLFRCRVDLVLLLPEFRGQHLPLLHPDPAVLHLHQRGLQQLLLDDEQDTDRGSHPLPHHPRLLQLLLINPAKPGGSEAVPAGLEHHPPEDVPSVAPDKQEDLCHPPEQDDGLRLLPSDDVPRQAGLLHREHHLLRHPLHLRHLRGRAARHHWYYPGGCQSVPADAVQGEDQRDGQGPGSADQYEDQDDHRGLQHHQVHQGQRTR